jgi:hypothetical protein
MAVFYAGAFVLGLIVGIGLTIAHDKVVASIVSRKRKK